MSEYIDNTLAACRRVAVLSDIHSNYHALAACYADALSRGVEGFILLGDYVSDLAEPRRTLDLVFKIIATHPTVALRGNRERYMLECRDGVTSFAPGSRTGSFYFTYTRLCAADLNFFASLPFSSTVNIGGVRAQISHSSPDSDRYYFDSEDARVYEVMNGMREGYLIAGHSHRQYTFSHGGKTVINPGSVGVPHNADSRADYALLDAADGNLVTTVRKVSYDIPAAIHSQFASGLVATARYWAIGILYDIITGGAVALDLLHTVRERGDAGDESLWDTVAAELGLKSTEAEMLDLYHAHTASLI